eukprot:SAG11_NODE_16999_length_531_cov_1.171296_1_plen_52_part_10
MPGGASGYCECTNSERDALSNCDHEPFTCDEVCRGSKYDHQTIMLTTYDMGR